MEIFDTNTLAMIATLAGMTVGIVQIAKNAGFPTNFAGLLSIVVGIALTFLVSGVMPIGMIVLSGITVGLTASGAYSVPKTIKEQINNPVIE